MWILLRLEVVGVVTSIKRMIIQEVAIQNHDH